MAQHEAHHCLPRRTGQPSHHCNPRQNYAVFNKDQCLHQPPPPAHLSPGRFMLMHPGILLCPLRNKGNGFFGSLHPCCPPRSACQPQFLQGGCGSLGRWTFTLHSLPTFFVIALEEEGSTNATNIGAYMLPARLDLGKVYNGEHAFFVCFSSMPNARFCSRSGFLYFGTKSWSSGVWSVLHKIMCCMAEMIELTEAGKTTQSEGTK